MPPRRTTSRAGVQKAPAPATILFHGSTDRIASDFRQLTHFGTRKAAMQRVGEVIWKHGWRIRPDIENIGQFPVSIHPVRLSIQNPLKISDGKNLLHTPTKIADMLFYDMKVISSADRDSVIAASAYEDEAKLQVVRILSAKGYDGLVYANIYEDQGSDSWVIFDSSQVTPAGEVEEMTYGELYSQLESEAIEPEHRPPSI